MAFIHGKNTKVYIDGYDLTSYLNAGTLSMSVDTAETTVFGLDSKTYISGLKDGSVSYEGLFDGTTLLVDYVFEAALGTDNVVISHCPQGDTAALHSYGGESVSTSYEVDSPVDDVVSVSAELNVSGDFTRQYVATALSAKTVTGATSAIDDNGGSSILGGYAIIQCTALNAGTLDVNLEHDSANTFDSGGEVEESFTQILTAAPHKAEMITISTNPFERYVRINWTLAGGATSATFFVSFFRA